MYAEISAAIQSAKALGELVKAAHGLVNYNEFVTTVYESCGPTRVEIRSFGIRT